ncbi:hypothetical protein N7466_003040 [Penicillium verhagenii]|uniref:uncharacterized protein n=1 Tax=Penicillium verhagenii TaxID=1562060 RepID=UPI0025451FF8|nr:uncharacterized protein N7466_003040 [Penicillium verhagenii]KAJ5936590.1 hypothetical protein N7466_003040 [Penicillium verhagenii]
MARKPTPSDKQRVRTGCLTCRKRRRKCDEQNPRCANCEVKGFTCKYGSDLAFMTPRSGQVASETGAGYTSITFVDESPAPIDKGIPIQQSTPSQSNPQESLDHASGDDIQSQDQDMPNLELRGILSPHGPIHHTEPTFEGHSGFALRYQRLVQCPTKENTSYETDLLRHFRYHVGPWMDTGDSNCALGVQVLLLSRSSRPLQCAILALSAGHRSLLSSAHSDDIVNMLRFRREEQALNYNLELERHTASALLLLQEILPSGLQQWRDIILPHTNHPHGFISPLDLVQELGNSLFWVYFKLDLAASIASYKAPIIPFQTFVQDGFSIHASQHIIQSNITRVYQQALCLLGHCLALIYEEPVSLQASSPGLRAFPSLRQSHFLSQWSSLWTDCQKFYNERPVEAQQIVDIRGDEADMDHNSAFPIILIFTTPMALVANVVYHTISFLLLTHKPRLLKSLPGPRNLTSHIWHAQAIAGIAACNDSPEQWDPVFVASLLLIGKNMSHETQQAVLQERLRIITARTGMNLEREIDSLQASWRTARYDEVED